MHLLARNSQIFVIFCCHFPVWMSIITEQKVYQMIKQSELAYNMLKEAEGAVSAKLLEAKGVSNETLRRLVKKGVAEKVAAGHYALSGRIDILHSDWVAFSLQVPRGVIGLLTAATYHDITQELCAYHQAFVPRTRANNITLGGDSGAKFETVSSRNDDYLDIGVDTITLSGTPIRITSKERTLLDLFIFSPFNSSTTDASARIPEETFLDALARCADDADFSFDRFHELANKFGCSSKVTPFTKTLRFGANNM